MAGKILSLLIGGIAISSFADNAAIAPKYLYTAGGGNEGTKIVCEPHVSVSAVGDVGEVRFEPSDQQYPSFDFRPQDGIWDLSPWGHVETVVSNTSSKAMGISMRVDEVGGKNTNTECVYLKPGESRLLKVIFGYQFGFKAGPEVKTSRIGLVKLFVNGKSSETRTFTFGDIMAAGATGEKPPVNPAHIVTVPENGVLLPMAKATAANVSVFNDAVGSFTSAGTLMIKGNSRDWSAVRFKPAQGSWNLGEWLKVTAEIKNHSAFAINPKMKIDGGESIETSAKIEANASGRIEIEFFAPKSWHAKEIDGKFTTLKDTVYKFESHRVKGVVFATTEKDAKYEVVSLKAEKVIAKNPDWLGKRPPVEAVSGKKWELVWHDEFRGTELNLDDWGIYTANYWDKRTHFTKDNVFLRDGCAVLKYEKKTGRHNDNPDGKETAYACGYLDTYGKRVWTYGYFEARMRLPKCGGLWPAFWTMPDRGVDKGPQWVRSDTWNSGMEFDVMEHLTAWGPNRFNIACHWDGYGKGHKSVGTSGAYVANDDAGFMTVGFLWRPGEYVVYGNGKEIGRFESPRICSVPSYIILYMVSGGWANVALDEGKLPSEFEIDWVRVWQEK